MRTESRPRAPCERICALVGSSTVPRLPLSAGRDVSSRMMTWSPGTMGRAASAAAADAAFDAAAAAAAAAAALALAAWRSPGPSALHVGHCAGNWSISTIIVSVCAMQSRQKKCSWHDIATQYSPEGSM